MKIYENAFELVGKTPLVKIGRYCSKRGLKADIIAKLEYLNPAGSVKDRVAKAMIEDAEKRGILKEGSVIIEPTSGNTGIGLAAAAAIKGYKVILTMPETMSVERRKLLSAYGAEIVLTDGEKGMSGAIEKADELAAKTPGSFIPAQFGNLVNPTAHYLSTGPEIWEDTGGSVDIFVAGVGTGGTLSGVGRFLKEKKPNVRVIAVEPSGSPLLSKGRSGAHGLQGIGANFVPKTLDTGIYDEVIAVSEEQAYEAARSLAREEGILCGISSGAALAAAKSLAEREENTGRMIVVLLPDTGDRYLSTPMFDD